MDDRLNFVEEPMKIVARQIKKLRRKHIPIFNVRWNARRQSEFNWEPCLGSVLKAWLVNWFLILKCDMLCE